MTELISAPLSTRPRFGGGAPPTAIAEVVASPVEGVEDEQHQARWNAWLAKGVRQDVATRRRILFVASVVGIGVAAWLSLQL